MTPTDTPNGTPTDTPNGAPQGTPQDTGPTMAQLAAMAAAAMDAAKDAPTDDADRNGETAETVYTALRDRDLDAIPYLSRFDGWDAYVRITEATDAAAEAMMADTAVYSRRDDSSHLPLPVGKGQAVWSILPHAVGKGEHKRTVPACYQRTARTLLAVLHGYRKAGALPIFAKWDVVDGFFDDDGDAHKVGCGGLDSKDETTRPDHAGHLGWTPAIIIPAAVREAVSAIIGACPITYGAAVAKVCKWVESHASLTPGEQADPAEAAASALLAASMLAQLDSALSATDAKARKAIVKAAKAEERSAKAAADAGPGAIPRITLRAAHKVAARKAKKASKGKKARSAL